MKYNEVSQTRNDSIAKLIRFITNELVYTGGLF